MNNQRSSSFLGPELVLLILALVGFLSTACKADEEFPLSAENTMWDPFKAAFVDAWSPNLGPYTRTMSSSAAVNLHSVRAVFESKAHFEKYQDDCREKPLSKVVKEVTSEDDKKAILSVLINTDDAMDLAFTTTDGLSLIPAVGERIWPIAVVSFLRGALNKTEYMEHITKTRNDLSTLMAIGGKLRYQERPYQASEGNKPWKIYRAVIYEVRVGDEVRLIPLFVQTVQVAVE